MLWFNNLKTTQKILIYILLNAIFFVALAAAGYYFHQRINKEAELSLITLLVFLAVLFQAVLSLIGAQILFAPLGELLEKVEEVANGNLSVKPAKIHSKDEIGKLNQSFNKMTNNLRSQITKEQFLRQVMVSSMKSLEIESIVNHIVTQTGKYFKADRCYFVEYDTKTQEHQPMKDYAVYNSSINVVNVAGIKLTKDQMAPIIRYVFKQKEVLVVDDINKVNLPDATIELLKKIESKSFMSAPVIFGENPIGRIAIHYVNEYVNFSDNDKDLLMAIANQAAIVIHQAQLFNQIQNVKNRESLLRTINETIRSTLDIEQVLRLICKETGEIFKVQRVTISQHPTDIIRSEYTSSPYVPGLAGIAIDKRIAAFWGKSLDSDIDYIAIDNINDAQIPDYLREFYSSLGFKSILGMPIKGLTEKWGGFVLAQTDNYRHWTQEEIELLKIISGQIYTAIKQAEAFLATKNFAEKERVSREFIETMRSTLDKNEIKRKFVTAIGQYFGASRVDLSEYDPVSQKFLPTDENSEYLSSSTVQSLACYDWSLKESECYTNVMKSKNEMNISDVDNYGWPKTYECAETKNWFKNIGIQSTYNIPILYSNELMGFFCIDYTEQKYDMKSEELEFLRILTKQCGIALYQSKLFDRERQLAERENSLRTITSSTLLSNNLEEAIKKSSTEIGKLFDADRTCFIFYDDTRKTFSQIFGEYRKTEEMPSTDGSVLIPAEFEQFMIDQLFNKKKIIVYGTKYESEEIPESFKNYIKNLLILDRIRIKTIIGAPIIFKDKPIGVMLITNTESFGNWSKEQLEFLEPLTQQISVGINLFILNEMLTKALNSEKAVRDIILEARELENHDLILNYLLEKLINLFDANRILHLHYDDNYNLFVHNEILKDKDLSSLLHQQILQKDYIKELESEAYGDCIVINDINVEVKDSNFKNLLINNNIFAFMIYPKPRQTERGEEIIEVTMICSPAVRKWSIDDIRSFKLIIDTSSLIYFEVLHRKETEELRKTFLATLTHDLRSPINAEQKAIEAILSEKLGTSLENFSEYLEDVYRTNEELLRIVNNLLMSYHYESRQIELNFELSNIENIIFDAVRAMTPLAKDQNSEIYSDIQENLPPIMIDKNEIKRVIINLLSNAIKHNEKNTNISVKANKINEEIEISIKDNGKGISDAEKANIFQRYPTTKRKIGTGLGLYLSKQIIDAHHGRIWFETEVGKGTTFYFALPIFNNR
jgi:GAF domain-containing protein/signal transduction histidine kinase